MRESLGCITTGREADGAQTSLSCVFRELINLLGSPDGHSESVPSADAGSEVVLLDLELDGLRYLLVRMPRQNHERLQLSPREYEIVRMVAKGHPNKVIADVLNISSWTVCTHLKRIFAKMGVGSRAAMVAQLLERGVVPHEIRNPTGPRSCHSSDSI